MGLPRNTGKKNMRVKTYVESDYNEIIHANPSYSADVIATSTILAILQKLPNTLYPKTRPELSSLVNKYSDKVVQEVRLGFPYDAIQEYSFIGAAREIKRFQPHRGTTDELFLLIGRQAEIIISTGRLHARVAREMVLALQLVDDLGWIDMSAIIEALYKSGIDFSEYSVLHDVGKYEIIAESLHHVNPDVLHEFIPMCLVFVIEQMEH